MNKIRRIYQGISVVLICALVVNLCGCSSASKSQNSEESKGQPVTENSSGTVMEKTEAEMFASELQAGFAELEALYGAGESEVGEIASKLTELVETSAEKLSEFNRYNAETVKSLGSDLLAKRQEAYEQEMEEKASRAKKLLEDFCDAPGEKEKKKSLKGLKKLFSTDPVSTYGSEPENLSEEAQIGTQEVSDLDSYRESMQEKTEETHGGDTGEETKEFLKLSGETALTDRIREKADELSTPLAVYNYLKNTIDYELYSGSRKGAGQTFDSLAGNDKDQASLMIAMLRHLGYPSRYAEGTVMLAEDQIKNLTGAKDIRTGAEVLASAGVPVTIITIDGEMTAVSFEHTWVETYVPYTDYRGAGKHAGESMWISLDTGIQTYKTVDTITDYIDEAVGGDTWEKCLKNTEKDRMSDQLEELVEQIKEEDIGDLSVRSRVKEENNVSYLPLSLQYTVLDRKNTYSEIKDTDVDTVEFSISGKKTETFRYSELTGKRITMTYEAETEEDARALEAYGTVFNTPAYLVRMRPVLKLDGKEVACGEAATLGTDQDFTMTLTSAGKTTEIRNLITAGSIYQVTLDGQTITAEELQKSYADYQEIAETAMIGNVYSDEYLGKILDVAGKMYFAQVDIANMFAAEACGVKATRSLSEGMTGYQVQTSKLYGVPVGIGEGSLFIDVDHDSHGAVSLTGSRAEEKRFMQTSGYISSLYESTIWEEFTGAEAVSTISIFQAAEEQGTDLLRIGQDNCETMLQELDADDATLEDVRDALDAGKEVTITQKTVTIGSWSGYGYIVMDPESGAAAYMISGGLNGGSSSGIVTLEALLGLALSAVTLSLLISDIIGILAVAASLTVFGWAVLAIEIYFLVSIVLYMITLCEDYTAYLNGDAEAGDRIIEEVMIFSASTLACICVLKILEAFGINVCEWINSKMYKPGTGGTGGAEGGSGGNAEGNTEGNTGDSTLGMENTGGEDAGSGTEGGSDVGADGGNTGESGSKTPSEIARSWQGTGKYPGIDVYVDVTVEKGTVLYRGEPNGTEYFTTLDAIEQSGRDATKLFEGLQVEKNPIHGYRGEMQGYIFNENVSSAYGIANANPQFGKGGLPQYYVPDVQDLIDKGILTPVDSIKLNK